MKKRSYILILVLALNLLTSCATVPAVIGIASGLSHLDREEVQKIAEKIEYAAEDIPPSQEYYVGRAVAATILSKYDVYQDETLRNYLNNILQVIVINSPIPECYGGYSIIVLDSDEINAFSTTGGHILITKGMIRCTSDEDELASVIAHEVAHFQLGHGVKAIRTNRVTNAVSSMINATVTYAADKNNIPVEIVNEFNGAVNEVTTELVDKGYSKECEAEADRYAVYLLDRAGYYPKAMSNMLNILKQYETPGKEWGKTHPSADYRLKIVNREYKKYSYSRDTSFSRVARFNDNTRSVFYY